jgi:hypothetical protein
MSAYALRLQQPEICGQDLAAGNALATTALDGFLNYPMYNAIGCQRNGTSDNYCIVEAAAQSSDKSSEMYWCAALSRLRSVLIRFIGTISAKGHHYLAGHGPAATAACQT